MNSERSENFLEAKTTGSYWSQWCTCSLPISGSFSTVVCQKWWDYARGRSTLWSLGSSWLCSWQLREKRHSNAETEPKPPRQPFGCSPHSPTRGEHYRQLTSLVQRSARPTQPCLLSLQGVLVLRKDQLQPLHTSWQICLFFPPNHTWWRLYSFPGWSVSVAVLLGTAFLASDLQM